MEKEIIIEEQKIQKPKQSKQILDFIIKSMNGMAYGLFATLIVGTILNTIGGFFADGSYIRGLIQLIAKILQNLTGMGIGLGVAMALKKDGLKLIALTAVGAIAAYFSVSGASNINIFSPDATIFTDYASFMKPGDPLTIYIVVIVASLLIDLILRKKTSVDIIIIPLLTIIIGVILTLLVNQPLYYVTKGVSWIVEFATERQPFIMGIVVCVVMGMALTAPISSAAIAYMIFSGTNPAIAIAGGAAVVGCSTQMIGFAVMSRKDNKIGTVLSVAFGTSMLQFKNIVKKPIIWLPTIIASAILGPISTCIIKVQCLKADAGMGTAGLVGLIGTYNAMENSWQMWVGIFGLQIVAPIILVWIIDVIFRKYKLIVPGDLTI